jgi:hypothetical protein
LRSAGKKFFPGKNLWSFLAKLYVADQRETLFNTELAPNIFDDSMAHFEYLI